MTEPSDTTVLAFGNHELDFGRRELREDGRPVELPPTPLRVLLYLAEHRDRAVPKNELMDTIWPDAIVTDTSLANALNQARLALGDDGTAQRVIRTQKGIGYRFVADCEVRAESEGVPGSEPDRSLPGRDVDPPETTGRRLRAILSADIAGYSRLMAEDEDEAIRAVMARRAEVELHVRQHRGRLVDFTGDNFLAEFGSAVEALECAVEIQEVIAALNRPFPRERKMEFRMGLHLGEIQAREGRLFGTGVNMAARLEGLAEPGGVCVSEPVHREVAGRSRFSFRDLGQQVVKNIPDPVRAYAVDVIVEAKREAGQGPLRRVAVAIAVLALILAAGLATAERGGLSFWWALNAPPALVPAVHQSIGFAESDEGVRIAFATSGAGPPLVFVRGWYSHLEQGLIEDSPEFVAAWSVHHMLVRFDGRGFGLSERSVADFSLEARVRDLEAVVDAAGLERFALIGASLGSVTAIVYAARYPERVTHLLLPSGTPGYGAVSKFIVGSEADFDRMIGLVRSSWERPTTRMLMASLVTNGRDERRFTTEGLAEFLTHSGDPGAFADYLEAVTADDVTAEATKVRAPTLLVVGAESHLPAVENARYLATRIPSARVEILPGATHVGAQRNAEAIRLMRDFLEEKPPAR